ncbi:MAG: TonB-dependent receptor [Desulfobacteraceae bacterium]|jgi:outer membrane cobalamin receptor
MIINFNKVRTAITAWIIMFLIIGAGQITAEEKIDADKGKTVKLEPLKVKSLEERLRRQGVLKDVIEKTQLITYEDIEIKQAGSLFELIKEEPGVTVNTECSMCGIKRIMVNGLKGEHTTVLVDGVPMHSVVSSYYGMDAMATAGVSRVEIARGAGPSLLSPEAIGGTINMIFDKPDKNGLLSDISIGSNGYQKYSVVGTAVTPDEKLAILAIAQYDDIDQEDADNNLVNEAPRLENSTLTLKTFYDFSDSSQLQFRVTQIKSDVHGGYMSDNYNSVLQDPGDPSFVNGDVRLPYTGAKLGTCEYILTEREEFAGMWLREVNARTNFSATASYSKHTQDSVYEGFDYRNEVPAYYGNLKINYSAGNHLITGGISTKSEELDADSVQVESDPNLIPDDYDYTAHGIFIQDSWQVNDDIELLTALRADKIAVDWTGQTTTGDEISETIIAPRAHLRWNHTPNLSSRISAGRGYRAPLTFFESEHGILEEGFNILITDLEKSWSAGYSLNYSDERWAATIGVNYTEVENLATISDDYDRPTLINSDEKGDVTAFDFSGSYKVTDWLILGASFEHYAMSDSYKATFSIAPIETRLGFSFDINRDGWDFNSNIYWIGSRDLTDYGYKGYNVYDETTGPSDLKTTDAPSYFEVNMRISKELGKYMSLYAGIKNLLDYTQAGDEDSPLFYDSDGAYDVGYIYAPLRGRSLYAGLKITF